MVRSLFDYDKYGNKHILFTTINKYFFLPFCLFANFSSFCRFAYLRIFLIPSYAYFLSIFAYYITVYFLRPYIWCEIIGLVHWQWSTYWYISYSAVRVYNKLIIISTFTFNNWERKLFQFYSRDRYRICYLSLTFTISFL